MVIFNTVLVKKYIKIITLVSFFTGMIFVSPTLAAEPAFSIYPAGGIVTNKNEGFTVDVMIDSAGEELTSARFVITFDPEYLKLVKTEKNNSLFAQWPEDEASVDNTNGMVMLTGFSQSGTDDLYITGDEPDVMARLTFEVLKIGKTAFNWEFTGSDDTFASVMLIEGSPPQNVLKTKPTSVTFTIQDKIVNTAIEWNKYILVGGLILILFGGLIMFSRPGGFSKKSGTVIVYDKE